MADAGGEVAQEDVGMNVAGEPSGKDEGVVAKVQVRDAGRCCVMPAAAWLVTRSLLSPVLLSFRRIASPGIADVRVL
jgi:hypothetical protein